MIGAAIAIAVAAPILGAALAGALAISTAVATALVTVGLSMAASLAFRALGLGAPKPSSQIGPPQVFRQSIANSFIVYGKRRVGGLLVFFHPRKVGKRHYRYFVIAAAGHRCQGVTKWFLNDEEVTVNSGTGAVTSGTYAGAAWLWFQRGLASETANATFVSECGGKWTSDHKGNGIAAIYAKFEMTDAVVQAGMPNITAEVEGRDEIHDPRDDSTGYTNNGALVFYDWLALPREEGGFGAYDDEIPDDTWISAQANVCDETVEGEARYALDGVIVTGAAPGEIRDVLTVNCAGTYAYVGGKHLMRVGYYVPPSETLSENDLAGPVQVSAFMASDVTANEVQGTYIEPDDGYQGAPFATQTTDPVSDDIKQLDLDLAFIASKYRGERIARIMLNRAQYEKTVVWPMNIAGLKVRALDTVAMDSTRYGLDNYYFQVTNWSLSADWGVILNLREENSDIYGEPTPVTPDSIPTIDVAEPVLQESGLASLVATSYVTDADPADGLLQGTEDSIVIESHTRTYADKTVSVTGDTLTGLIDDLLYHIYYDDDTRSGGAVTFVATTTAQDAATSAANPGRHYVGSLRTDVIGGTGTSGGGATPSGWDSPNYIEP